LTPIKNPRTPRTKEERAVPVGQRFQGMFKPAQNLTSDHGPGDGGGYDPEARDSKGGWTLKVKCPSGMEAADRWNQKLDHRTPERGAGPPWNEAYLQSLLKRCGDSLQHCQGVALIVRVFQSRNHELLRPDQGGELAL